MFHDASPTWSGFAYQGKVGLLVVLNRINTCRGNNIADIYKSWKLEFEWLEDFSIIDGNEYISLHQVKAYIDRGISKYKTAIDQLVRNSLMYYAPQLEHYLHVTANVNFASNCLYNYQIGGRNQKYCPLMSIDELIKSEVRSFLNRYNEEDENDEAIDIHFYKLLSIIDDHVKSRHHVIQTTTINQRVIECIDFVDIINSLTTNSMHFSNERMIYEKKEYFISLVNELCQDLSFELQTKVNNFSRDILNLGDEDFIKFSKSIFPHMKSIYNSTLSILNFQELLHRDHMIDAFFKIIQEIELEGILIQHKFYYYKENKKYLPTGIQSSNVSRISNEIMENPFAVEDLYEMDIFITERIIADSIELEANNISEVSDEDLQVPEEKEYKITELKKVRMININEAKRVLND
ncbi:MAG: hypothetical protein RBR54_05975 [Sulfurimonas sp.]|nr:hypothetical protein [Sulfurimonas sp.]